MVVIVLGVVLGAWALQQQASLPHALPLTLAWCVLLALNVGARWYLRRHGLWISKYPRLITASKRGYWFVIAALFGFTWASVLATYRLADALPSAWEQKNITLIGVVASLPEYTEHGQRFVFDVEQVLTPQAQVPKRISLSIYPPYPSRTATTKSVESTPQASVGERWQWTVRLKRPHGVINPHGFDFEAWALSERIRATGAVRLKSDMRKLSTRVNHPRYWVDYARAKVASRITDVLADKPYAGVIRALVIGDDSQISRADWDIYMRTGTNHLMSISGLHITMLSGLVFALTYWLWRRYTRLLLRLPARKAAAVAGMIAALLYAALAGFSIPTQRTLYMLMTVTVMLWLDRPINMPKMLAIALLVVVVMDPWAVNAAGFWLSFGAVAVIAYAMGGRIGRPHWLMEAVKVQWVVTLGLLPLLVAMFGQFSLISPIANAFAIPVISFLVVPAAILGSLLPIDLSLQLSHAILSVTMAGLNWLSAMPLATWQQAAPSIWTLLLAMFGVIWWLLPRGVPMRWLGTVCMLPLFSPHANGLHAGDLRVTVLDVGQGLSVFVQTAQHTMLYDAGTRYDAQSDAGMRIVIPFLRAEGVGKLSGVALSHDDLDHSGGVASVVGQVPTAWLLSSLSPQASLLQQPPFDTWPQQKKITCHAGQHWQWDQVRFEVLYPNIEQLQNITLKDNDKSCVIKITSRYGAVLLTGDIERGAESALIESAAERLNSDVLIVPHHGSKTSSTPAFIEAVGAQHVVMTNGYLNRFGHPKPVIEQRYLNHDAHIYRSDHDGAVQFAFQANQPMTVTPWRKVFPRYWHDRYP